MELGNKIKKLRLRAGLTQETLAEELGVSFQTISKWENNVCAPDIMMLPKLSVYFGVTIDELFDLTTEQRLHRIETMLDVEQELPYSTFLETVNFLQELLEGEYDKARIYNFLAHVFHHRVLSDCDKVDKYTRKALQLRPDMTNCKWMFQKTAGAAISNWNERNHHRLITFYKELIEANPAISCNYLELMDNLLADNRTKEAAEYLTQYQKLKEHQKRQVPIYEARIALAEHKETIAAQKMKELEADFPEDGRVMFEMANYYASQCQYEQAIIYYEKSFALEKANETKPLYTDALEGMAVIYEIQGDYEKAVSYYDRVLQVLKEEFGFEEGEPVRVIEVEKQRVMELIRK